jgi:hypothetical protein
MLKPKSNRNDNSVLIIMVSFIQTQTKIKENKDVVEDTKTQEHQGILEVMASHPIKCTFPDGRDHL